MTDRFIVHLFAAAVPLTLVASEDVATASLLTYESQGVGLVYSDVSDISWSRDANLFRTLSQSDPGLVDSIVSLGFQFDDPFYGLRTVSADDFWPGLGRMTWWGALAWVEYLNHIAYGGSTEWRLPSVGDDPDTGRNNTTSEFGELFYTELGAEAFENPWPATDFVNVGTGRYWFQEFLSSDAWNFDRSGLQFTNVRTEDFEVWVVTPGMVAHVVPGPIAALPALAGLAGVVVVGRRFR